MEQIEMLGNISYMDICESLSFMFLSSMIKHILGIIFLRKIKNISLPLLKIFSIHLCKNIWKDEKTKPPGKVCENSSFVLNGWIIEGISNLKIEESHCFNGKTML